MQSMHFDAHKKEKYREREREIFMEVGPKVVSETRVKVDPDLRGKTINKKTNEQQGHKLHSFDDESVSFKGLGVGKIEIFFKELTPHLWTYELRSQGGKNH